MSTDKFCEQSRPAEEFGRPPESVVMGCRARMGRPIAANVSEASRQRAKASARKELKKASLIFLIFRQSFEAKSSECRLIASEQRSVVY
jgi:hypothetical protein